MEDENRHMSAEPFIVRHLHAMGQQHHVPVSATFELTSRCNFSCKMCYVHSVDCNKNKAKELSAEQWLQIAQQAKDAGSVLLLLTGGEPLLRDDFCVLYEALAKMGFVISINSNLSLLSEKHIALFQKYRPNRINASLYGVTDDTYEALCGVPACDKVMQNIAALREVGVPVKINCTVTPFNQGELEQIFAFAREREMPIQATSYMFPALRCQNPNVQARFGSEDAGRISVAIDRLTLSPETFAQRTQRIAEGLAVERNTECPEEPVEGSFSRCRGGVTCAWIDWQGDMSFCGMVPATPGNNVIAKGFSSCWEQVQREIKAVRLPAKCETCNYRHLCSICAACAYTETGAFDKVPSYVCRMTQSMARIYESLACEKQNFTEK